MARTIYTFEEALAELDLSEKELLEKERDYSNTICLGRELYHFRFGYLDINSHELDEGQVQLSWKIPNIDIEDIEQQPVRSDDALCRLFTKNIQELIDDNKTTIHYLFRSEERGKVRVLDKPIPITTKQLVIPVGAIHREKNCSYTESVLRAITKQSILPDNLKLTIRVYLYLEVLKKDDRYPSQSMMLKGLELCDEYADIPDYLRKYMLWLAHDVKLTVKGSLFTNRDRDRLLSEPFPFIYHELPVLIQLAIKTYYEFYHKLPKTMKKPNYDRHILPYVEEQVRGYALLGSTPKIAKAVCKLAMPSHYTRKNSSRAVRPFVMTSERD